VYLAPFFTFFFKKVIFDKYYSNDARTLIDGRALTVKNRQKLADIKRLAKLDAASMNDDDDDGDDVSRCQTSTDIAPLSLRQRRPRKLRPDDARAAVVEPLL